MSIPTAVSPSVVTPGLYLVVNLLAGASAPGIGELRILIAAPKGTSGDLTVDTEIRAGGGEASAATAFGTGTFGHLAAKEIYAQFPQALVDFAAPTAGAGTATNDFVFSGSPSSNTAVRITIHGVVFEVAWNASETADTMRDRVIAAIQARTSVLAVTAVSGGVGTVTVNCKVTGQIGNDVLIKAVLTAAQTGTEAVTLNTLTALAGGTTSPDPATLISNLGKEYHYILPVTGNSEAHDVAGGNPVKKWQDHINGNNTGINAKLQQLVVASTGSIALAKTAAAGRNDGVVEHVLLLNGQSPPSQLAAREVGGRIAALQVDVNPNRIGEVFTSIVGAEDLSVDRPTDAELEDALTSGVAICSYDSSDRVKIVRPITTYSTDSSGGADRRLLDVNIVDATYIVSRDLKSFLIQEYPNAKVTKDTEPGEEPPPKNVIEERDIRTSLITRLRFWEREGVVDRTELNEVITSGELAVQVNASDPTQVDILVPSKIIPILAKFGLVVERRAS